MGTETTVDEIFEDVNAPEKYREDIAVHLVCPNCGKSSFEQYEVAGTDDADDIEIKRQLNVIAKFANKRESLRVHLETYPSLALAHPMGKTIRKEILDSREKSIKIPL